MEKKAYQLKVTLRDTRPAIWRRLEVRADVTLGRLHEILQVAMGWTDSHLHQFLVKGKYYGKPDPDDDMEVKNGEDQGSGLGAPSEARGIRLIDNTSTR